ncbi:MAG: DUF4340 domain-containing protein [Kiritimatiellaeota bacterium]|nr:DUF4340 domain-containing protein [Kiritimatiellota bacterium]
MKTRQLLYLFIGVVIVVAVGVFLQRRSSRDWQSDDGSARSKLLTEDDLARIDKVTVTDKDGMVELRRKEGTWRVAQRYDYPANFSTLSEFLRDLVALKGAQEIEVGPSQYGRLNLLAPDADKKDETGTDIKLFDKSGKLVAELRLGKEHRKPSSEGGPGGSWPDGRYILLPQAQRVLLVGKTFSSVEPKPKSWLDKEFFKVPDMKTGKLIEAGKTVWEVQREKKTDDMKLVGLKKDEKQDDSKVRSISTAFSWASFEDVADPALPPEKTGMDKPKTFVASDFDGFEYTVKIGKKTKDDKYYLAVDVAYKGPTKRTPGKNESDDDKKKKDAEFKKTLEKNRKKAADLHKRLSGWVFVVSKYTVDDILKERKDLLKKPEKKEKETAAKPAAKSKSKKIAAKGKKVAPAAKPAVKNPPAPKKKTAGTALKPPKPPAKPKAKAAADDLKKKVQQAAAKAAGNAVKKLNDLKTGVDKAKTDAKVKLP